MKIFSAIFFLIFVTTVSADESSFDFKGLELGSDISQIENDDRYRCRKGKYGETVCFVMPDSAEEQETIAGVRLTAYILLYVSNKLGSITIYFPSKEFLDVAKALVFKYGEGEIKTEILENNLGKKFENTIMTWRRGNSTLEATQYYKTIKDSAVMFYTDFFTEEYKRLKTDKAKKMADDL